MIKYHRPSSYEFPRFLESKVNLDDRSLNLQVRQALEEAFGESRSSDNPRIIEFGAGIGTMIERLMRWKLFGAASYQALDIDSANLIIARERIRNFADQHDIPIIASAHERLELATPDGLLKLEFSVRDARALFLPDIAIGPFDLIIAHAFMDLVDLETAIPAFVRMSSPGGLLYLTINYDGMTRFRPVIDHGLDDQIEALYNQSMDERIIDDQPSGDSRTGISLLAHLPVQGVDVLAAGASDWVVYPKNYTYKGDEAYFLHHIIHTIDCELQAHPKLDRVRFQAWIEQRHSQIEAGELTYIAHQLDILGQVREITDEEYATK